VAAKDLMGFLDILVAKDGKEGYIIPHYHIPR
jgi:hypothetical protein